jgi:ribosomal small subunit protein bTHX
MARFPVGAQRYNRSIPHSFDGERMGKGDVRTRRGKIFNHSYGKKRRHKQKQMKKRTAAG